MAVLAPDQLRLRRVVLLAIFVVSCVGLSFEITLTRLFSLFFQYHFTFLAVSIAVLGISLGAASAQILLSKRTRPIHLLANLLVALSLSLSVATVIIARLPWAGSVLPRAAVAFLPFFLIGVFTAVAFEHFASSGGHLYAADLIGAAFGVILVLLLLNVASGFSIALLLAAVVASVAFVFARSNDSVSARRQAGRATASLVLAVALLLVNQVSGAVDFQPLALTGVARDKTMVYILQDPSQEGRIAHTAWSPFARVDVIETRDESAKYLFTDGGAGSFMLRQDEALETQEAWANTIDYLPFTGGPVASTLIIGAGGGKDIVMALAANAEAITAVEVNPAVVAATRRFAEYNGSILDHRQVTLIEGDARSFVEQSENQYDLIYMNLVYTQAPDPAGYTLVENYIFTTQAFQAFFDRLAPGGRLGIVSHNALEASRAAVTALQMLEDRGIPPAQALDHLWVWMVPGGDQTTRTSVLLLSKAPLLAATVEDLNATARGMGMQPLFAPGSFEALFEPLRNGASMYEFIVEGGPYNLSPTDDDSPYFFNLDYGLPPAIQSTLLLSLVLTGGLLAYGLKSSKGSRSLGGIRTSSALVYAALTGLGFMLVEIPLIQRFQLLFGQPVLALSVVLATLLLSGGLGSLLSQRWQISMLPSRVALASLLIAGIIATYALALPQIAASLLVSPFGLRLLATVIITAMLGVPMGIPFPSLIRLAGQSRQQVSVVWAINGAFSVLGSTLTVVISMHKGFTWALLLGAFLYVALAMLVSTLFIRSPVLVRQEVG
jgi:spermidine synthase